MKSLVDEMKDVIHMMGDAKVPYALCGGLSMAVHGFPRATMDIDLLILKKDLETALSAVEPLGYIVKGPDMDFKEQTIEIRRISKIDDNDEILSLDFLLVTEQVKDVWESIQSFSFESLEINVVSKDGLIKMKKLAGRPQDLADIENLEK